MMLADVWTEPNTGCWLWAGTVNRKGYGIARHDGKPRLAHRVAYAQHHGPIPAGMFVCHRCDQPCCVNPDHLYAGTPKQNTADMFRRNRVQRKGKKRPNATRGWTYDKPPQKITDEQVVDIDQMKGRPMREVAEIYGISETLVWGIWRGRKRQKALIQKIEAVLAAHP